MKTKYYKSILIIILWAIFGINSAFSQEITIYTMEGCGRCAFTVDYFKKNGIKFTEYSTSNDENNQKMWNLLWAAGLGNGESVSMPVIIVDGKLSYSIPNLETFVKQIGKGKQNPNNNSNLNNIKKTGCISGDCVDGKGIYVWDNGDTYTGYFKNGNLNGEGKYIWSTGVWYDGDWIGNTQNGYGVFVDENGYKTQGTWVNGQLTKVTDPIDVDDPKNNNDPVNHVNTNSDKHLTKAQKDEFVRKHNEYRNEVGSVPLQWSDELAQYAQAWGEHLVSLDCDMQHRPHSGEWAQKYGENLYRCSGMLATPSGAVDSWGEEKGIYDGRVISNSNLSAGHYTQMIWYKTTLVGCAIVTCSGNQYLVVCNYSPAGNYIGESPYKK
jgi:pathogenesis-related protein 1